MRETEPTTFKVDADRYLVNTAASPALLSLAVSLLRGVDEDGPAPRRR